MSEELDPQQTPDEGQVQESGQGEDVTPDPAPDEGQAERERLAKLEQSYKEAHRTITRLTQKISDYEKKGQPAEADIPPDAYFTDPVNTTKKVMASVLSEFEARQEQKRQVDRLLQEVAEENGLTRRQMEVLNEEFQAAMNDPREYLGLLARINTANNASSEIQKAAKLAKDSVARNARAVTSEASRTQVSPPGKAFEEMSLEEMRQYIAEKHGIAPQNY